MPVGGVGKIAIPPICVACKAVAIATAALPNDNLLDTFEANVASNTFDTVPRAGGGVADSEAGHIVGAEADTDVQKFIIAVEIFVDAEFSADKPDNEDFIADIDEEKAPAVADIGPAIAPSMYVSHAEQNLSIAIASSFVGSINAIPSANIEAIRAMILIIPLET
jgi:hypothetical protein